MGASEGSASERAPDPSEFERDLETLSRQALRTKYSKEATSHRNMLRRCKGEGRYLAPEWRDFPTFLRDMGPSPSPEHTLDCIDPVAGGCAPGRVRWADKKTQTRNRTNTRLIPFQGEQLPIGEVAERLGVKYQTFYSAIRRGETADRIAQRQAEPNSPAWRHPDPEKQGSFIKEFAAWRRRLRPGFEPLAHPEVFYLLKVYRVLYEAERRLAAMGYFEESHDPAAEEMLRSEAGEAWLYAQRRRDETLAYLTSARPDVLKWFDPASGRLLSYYGTLIDRAQRGKGP